ncbi:MAG: sugar transferase [Bacteroidales bacterium]|nr:sugar transferase [Bacteroidales bacterium]
MIRRLMDIIISLVVLIVFSPFMVIIAILIKLDSKGPIIFKQIRVGKGMKEFIMYKFRTMYTNAEQFGKLTIGNDKRITKIGKYLRKYKLDELPQFFNVLKGDMSIVGPRPEVPDYTKYYSDSQKEIFNYKPGITDEASLLFYNESEILSNSFDPHKFYIEKIMPLKIETSLNYLKNRTIFSDLLVILKTFFRISNLKNKKFYGSRICF